MPQRTHGPTNAAAKANPAPTPPKREPRPDKSSRSGKDGQRGGNASSSATIAPSQSETTAAPGAHPLAPGAIARTLRAVADALERDPALARRVAADAGYAGPAEGRAQEVFTPPEGATAHPQRPFRPRIVTGADATLGPGIPDPFALRADRGESGLRAALEELRLGTLRAIIRAHHLDPSGRLAHHNDAARLRTLIVDATAGPAPARGE